MSLFGKKSVIPNVYPVPSPPPVGELPSINMPVVIQLNNGTAVNGYWDGVNWWSRPNGYGEIPVVAKFVGSWYKE